MSYKKDDARCQVLSMMVLAAAAAVLTYPILKLIGVHDLLVSASAECTNMLFKLLGIQP